MGYTPADWSTGVCVNDGRHPTWTKEEDCCGYKFEYKFDTCIGPPTKTPTDRPSPNPTMSPMIVTEPPTHVWGAALIINSGNPTVRMAEDLVAVAADVIEPVKTPMKYV